MTVILGLVDRGECLMAADSGVWEDKFVWCLGANSKLFKFHGAVIGGAGDLEALQFVHTWCTARSGEGQHDPVQHLSAALGGKWPFPADYNVPDDIGFLVGHQGFFSELSPNGAVYPRGRRPVMLGEGELALGAVMAMDMLDASHAGRWRLEVAMEAQQRHGDFCRAPFTILREGG